MEVVGGRGLRRGMVGAGGSWWRLVGAVVSANVEALSQWEPPLKGSHPCRRAEVILFNTEAERARAHLSRQSEHVMGTPAPRLASFVRNSPQVLLAVVRLRDSPFMVDQRKNPH